MRCHGLELISSPLLYSQLLSLPSSPPSSSPLHFSLSPPLLSSPLLSYPLFFSLSPPLSPLPSSPLSSLVSWDMVYACWNIVGEYYQDSMQRTQSIHIVAILITILCSFFNYCTVLTVSGMHFIIALHYTSLSKSSVHHITSLHDAVSRGKTYT